MDATEPLRFLPLVLTAALAAQTHDELAGKAAVKCNADQLRRTTLAAHLQHPLEAGTNLLWCATMQLAWDELGTAFGSPPRFAEASPAGDGLAKRLVGKDDLDPRSYVARAGRGRDGILQRIREDLQRVFGGAASPALLPATIEPDQLIAYAYLWKHLPFELPFRRSDRPLRFRESDVAAFGRWSWHGDRDEARRMDQLQVLRYDGPQQFVVELVTKGKDDRLLVARTAPGKTLHETVTAVMTGLEAKPAGMDTRDRFEMPKLDFDLTRRFSELMGKTFANEGFRDQVLLEALQNVRFQLDENGAILKSEATLAPGSAATRGEPRRMVCDGPFLVLLARRGRPLPYFALWVGNDELLLPAAKPAAGARKGADR